jgi:hypothetical protein
MGGRCNHQYLIMAATDEHVGKHHTRVRFLVSFKPFKLSIVPYGARLTVWELTHFDVDPKPHGTREGDFIADPVFDGSTRCPPWRCQATRAFGALRRFLHEIWRLKYFNGIWVASQDGT